MQRIPWRSIIDIILTINLVLLLVAAVYLWSTGRIVIEYQPESAPLAETDYFTMVNAFRTAVREEVDRVQSDSVTGFEPVHYLETFPGLVATDFDNVEAGLGKYVFVEGSLVHVMPPSVLINTGAAVVSPQGLETLLFNIAARTQIDLLADGTVTDIMRAISSE